MGNAPKPFFQLAFSQPVLKNAIKVALIVGTLLALINYADKILVGSMLPSDYFKLFVTYFVPYAVSTYSAVKALQNS